MPKASQTVVQAKELRNMAYRLAKRITEAPDDENLREQARTLDSLVRAWETACERERIAKGKPLPGSLRPERGNVKRAGVTWRGIGGKAVAVGGLMGKPIAEEVGGGNGSGGGGGSAGGGDGVSGGS